MLKNVLFVLLVTAQAQAAETAAAISRQLSQMAVDPARIWRVRDLQLSRGDIKFYLSEGIWAFTKPIAGKTVAAVFTTQNTEAGDAEVIAMPASRGERASLANFIKAPNLNEHLTFGVFFFSDDTERQVTSQINDRPLRPAPEEAASLDSAIAVAIQADARQLDVKLIRSLLDEHSANQGFFYGILGGTQLGSFAVAYEPDRFEPNVIGRANNDQVFQAWASFRPRHSATWSLPVYLLSNYRLETTIHPDLGLNGEAAFDYAPPAGSGPVIALDMSARLKVNSADIDGQPAEIYQHSSLPGSALSSAATFLLIAGHPLASGKPHHISVRYQGSVIRQTGNGNYFVDDRNTWYPSAGVTRSIFDLVFHCPESLRLVSVGELISEEVQGGIRTIHRKTAVPEALAGFNLGDYETAVSEHGPYRIELFANRNQTSADLPEQTARILDFYSRRWTQLPIHSLAVSPIEGYFGQGFPGLIYLSSMSFLREEDRPKELRNPLLDSFFSEMLLPHEIAHQWWGNTVTQADYRTAWLLEAMSNYSALEFLEQKNGRPALDAVLERYRENLRQGESAGPVDFGERLIDSAGLRTWHTIVYEKGAWILHMLRGRLGDRGFHELQMRLLAKYSTQPISNEGFRQLAAELLPANQADPTLALFFENWVYSTGIPKLTLRGATLKMSNVEDAFSADVPLRCADPAGKERTVWIRAIAGDNPLDASKGRACRLPELKDFLYFN